MSECIRAAMDEKGAVPPRVGAGGFIAGTRSETPARFSHRLISDGTVVMVVGHITCKLILSETGDF